ncbi:MAG: hypothetical protein B6V02_01490 [Thermoprotei archaeon ex4572_64]|nr:MAG: hypothetical protein B6V02_01490 [Thermoprotei archaeon ex4572_64]
MINDNMINALAGALNGEGMTMPSSMAFSEDVQTLSPTATNITGILDSDDTTNSRTTNVTKFTGVRSGTSVISPTGDYLNTLGLFTSEGGTLMATSSVANFLHTDDFDLEVDWEITVSRG